MKLMLMEQIKMKDTESFREVVDHNSETTSSASAGTGSNFCDVFVTE